MANYTGADVITASDVTKYQPDAFDFGIASILQKQLISFDKLLTIYSDN